MIQAREVRIDGRAARLHAGGAGPALLLVHGAWGGAAMHWAPVWETLAERHRVIAPDLPGIADSGPGLPTFGAYARWLGQILQHENIDRAVLVGNSFGGVVAWELAAQAPGLCRKLVLVNGGPVEHLPRVAAWVIAHTRLRRRIAAMVRKGAWSREAIERAFVRKERIPPELLEKVARPEPPPALGILLDAVLSGEPVAPPPRAPTLLLWGADDGLSATTAKDAVKLQGRVPGARLVLLPGAGHLPQADRPDEFVRALSAFAEEP